MSGGRVLGDVDVIDLLLDDGGVVRGHVTMRKGEMSPPEPLPLEGEDDAGPEPESDETLSPPQDDWAGS